jgi:NADH dehydrogenase/NADH:ubiquinone oxidoreductase subunit G
MNLQITIDGHSLSVEKGTTILQAARKNDIYIPTLCDLPGLTSRGNCRMCIVEIQGKTFTPAACTALVENEMVVQTNSPKVQALRSELLQMLLAEHPCSCLICPENSNCEECMVTLRKSGVTTGCRSCPKDGQCELQDLVKHLGIQQVSYPVHYHMLTPEKFDPFFDRDYNLCILCGRCITNCDERHFTNIISYTQRGNSTVVGTAFNRSHLDAGCTFCGSCVEVCPVGALTEKTRKWDGKPQAEILTTCPLCSVGCQMRLLSRGGRIIGSLPDHSTGTGSLCVEGRFGFVELLNHPDRLKQPQRTVGEYQLKIEWDLAIQQAAEKLKACSPDRFQMILSSDLSNEDLYIAHKFAQKVMGTAPQTSSVHPYSAEDWARFLLLLKQAQPLSVLEDAGAILSLGVDGKYAQSVLEVAIHRARMRGAGLVTVHPFDHSLGLFADEWLRPAPGDPTQHMVRILADVVGEAGMYKYALAVSDQREQVNHAAQILREAKNPVVLLGTEFLIHLDMQELAPAVQALLDVTGARLVLIPQEGNLAGALLFASLFPAPVQEKPSPDLIYLIGVDAPDDLPGSSEVIYQNIFQSSNAKAVSLQLPSAAFSETNGTTVDHGNRVAIMNQAVQPPDGALPTWEILVSIARRMGVDGFDFTSEEDIRKEIESLLPGFKQGEIVPWDKVPTPEDSFSQMRIEPAVSHAYMGQPLKQRVAGLRDLEKHQMNKEWAVNVQHS